MPINFALSTYRRKPVYFLYNLIIFLSGSHKAIRPPPRRTPQTRLKFPRFGGRPRPTDRPTDTRPTLADGREIGSRAYARNIAVTVAVLQRSYEPPPAATTNTRSHHAPRTPTTNTTTTPAERPPRGRATDAIIQETTLLSAASSSRCWGLVPFHEPSLNASSFDERLLRRRPVTLSVGRDRPA